MNKLEQDFWDVCANGLSIADRPSDPRNAAQMAGDERVADDLLTLYLLGKKRAGSGLVKQYERDSESVPKIGDLWRILDKAQVPKCTVRTTRLHRLCPDGH